MIRGNAYRFGHLGTGAVVACCTCACVGTLHAAYDVALAVEGGALQHWTVSNDGKTWTQGVDIIPSVSSVRQVAAPGDGYVYVPVGSQIDRYQYAGGAWTKKDTWKTGLSSVVRVCMSPDRVWFYLSQDWGAANLVWRYRVSDPTIGGSLGLNAQCGFTRCRHFIFGHDGILYCGARGETKTQGAADYGTANPTRGVFAFDTTLSGTPLLHQYRLDGTTENVGIIVDDHHGRIYASRPNKLVYFGMGGETSLQDEGLTGFGNAFGGCALGDLRFLSEYAGGSVWMRDLDAGSMTKIPTVASCNAISDVTLVNTATSQLPYINGVWYMNETSGTTTLVNGANPGTWDMTLFGTAKAGASGATRTGVVMRNGAGRGVIADSATLVPGTGDFTISLWAFVGKDNTKDRKLFSNGTASIGLTMSGKPYFRIGDDSNPDFALYDTSSCEDNWTWIVVRRHGGAFELWVNNALRQTVSYNAATSIASEYDWTLGAKPTGEDTYAGEVTDAFFDDLRVYPKALTTDDMTHLYRLVRPLVKAESTSYSSEPQVRMPVAWQASAVTLNGTCYAAVNGELWRENAGSWSRLGEIGLDAVSLFCDDATLYAVGRNAAGLLAITHATLGATTSWSVPAVVGSGLRVPTLVATRPALAGGRVWLGAPAQGAWDAAIVSFAFAGGTASDPRISRDQVPGSGIQQPHVELTAVQAFARNGSVMTLGASKRSSSVRGEALLMSQRNVATPTVSSFDGTVGFPSGSKPFGAIWDETSRRYWLVSAAWHRRDKVKTEVPFFKATSLALYSSSDLVDWWYHGDYTVAGKGYYYRPTPVVKGDDLIVLFADKLVTATLSSCTIANFRTLWKGQKRKREAYLADDDEKRVYKYVYEPTIREWVPSGIFCGGSYTAGGKTYTMGTPQTVRTWNDRIFVNSRGVTKGVFEFLFDGTFVAFYSIGTDTDGLGVALDGSKVYATQWWGSNVYTIDRATGTVTARNFGTGAEDGLSVSRGIADLGGGRIAVSSRGTNRLLVWEPENGNAITSYGPTQFGNAGWESTGLGPQDIQYDADTKRLWILGPSCGYAYLDFSGAQVTYTRLGADGSYVGFARWDDETLLCSKYQPGTLVQLTYNGSTLTADELDAVSGSRSFDRVFLVAYPPAGTLILLR